MSRLVVTSHRPWRNRALAAGLALATVLSGWGLFEYGRSRAGFDTLTAQQQQTQLSQRNAELMQEIVTLREEKAVLERSIQIDRQAYKALESTVGGLQADISEYKSELAFYRGIVSPKDAQQGLRVEAFDIAPNGVENGFRYKLVLTQVLKSDRLARGRASFEVEGLQDGQNKTLLMHEVNAEAIKFFSFNFKYFQNFEGDLTLPAGFIPLRVVVKVDPTGGNADKVEKIVEWPVEEA
ncbi:MAG: hypothetical protein CVV05_03310 [Gammaproteobacteria bacterium HGW-Gammaproteobacteria-1]|jgi:hypothetical protein|nr:MAG: hypothetical protein CVV05_03310 [Gammaproteobacteria bacterium HGW-Gammaproteobacteria-1]